jgi:hypothetical protein
MNEEEIPKCYVVVEVILYEGYYFNKSKVFVNRLDAEKYIEELDDENSFDIIELDLIKNK